jgi:phage terminase large subunit-like protein
MEPFKKSWRDKVKNLAEIDDRLVLEPPAEEWAPAYYTKPRSFFTRGHDVAEFAKSFCTVITDKGVEVPFVLTFWQAWLICALLEENPETGYLRYRRAIVGVPRKNGKTAIAAILTLYHLVFSNGGEQIFCVANDLKQARIVYNECERWVKANPYLRKRIMLRRDYMMNIKTGVILRPLPADGKSAQGLGPTFTTYDELHEAPKNGELWEAMAQGSANRKESLLLGITTAGDNKDSLLGSLYEYGKKVASGEIDDPYFGFFWWEAPETDDPTDPETWRKANPSLGEGLLEADDFEAALKASEGSDLFGFMRYKLNQWVRITGASFIHPWNWDKACKPSGKIPKGAKVSIGFDGSRNNDSTGLVLMDIETGIFELAYAWEKNNQGDHWKVPRHEVEEAVEKLFEDYDVQMLYGDIAYWGTDLDNWAARWPGRIYACQGNSMRMGPITVNFLTDIHKPAIFHTGDERLTKHAMNAVMTEKGLPAKEKRNSKNKIDFLQCAILANEARRHAIAMGPRRPQGMPVIPR